MHFVDNEAVLSVQSFDSYLESQFLPYIKSLYATTVKVHTNLEDVFKLMVEAIRTNERTENDISFPMVELLAFYPSRNRLMDLCLYILNLLICYLLLIYLS
jgi:hypothetical protein